MLISDRRETAQALPFYLVNAISQWVSDACEREITV